MIASTPPVGSEKPTGVFELGYLPSPPPGTEEPPGGASFTTAPPSQEPLIITDPVGGEVLTCAAP